MVDASSVFRGLCGILIVRGAEEGDPVHAVLAEGWPAGE